MFSRWVRCLLVLSALVGLAACSLTRPREPLQHQVELGDTLYSIAWHYGLDWKQVAKWNDIGPPYAIYAGQAIRLSEPQALTTGSADGPPVIDLRVADPATAPNPPPTAAVAKVTTAKLALPRPAPKPVRRAAPVTPSTPDKREKKSVARLEKPSKWSTSNGRDRWKWPTDGKIVTPFAPGKGKKGVDIGGRLGQPVVASAEGDVVYSGKGLIGYGNLVIIKHDDTWLSAYGHNSRLLVNEGDQVSAGQTIAEMGQTPKTGSILHFEIRKNGKPVDPTRYLPTK